MREWPAEHCEVMYLSHVNMHFFLSAHKGAMLSSLSYCHLGLCILGNDSDLELEKKYKEDDREKTPKRPRTQRTEKVQKTSMGKEAGPTSGAKKPIISVVLTAHEAIPGGHNIGGDCYEALAGSLYQG